MSRTTKNYSSQSHLKGVAVLLLALLAIAPLSGCGPEKGAETETVAGGLALYTQDDTFISTIVQDLERHRPGGGTWPGHQASTSLWLMEGAIRRPSWNRWTG